MIAPFRFGTFFAWLLVAFLFTWLALVVLPWLELGHLQPIRDTASNDITPWDKPNEAHAGERVYAANGCAYCHTQQVRAATSGADLVRGWGTARDEDNKEITRRTYPRDYIWDQQVFLGTSREGADLTNVGQRFPHAQELYRFLYDPALTQPHSSMPEYRYLFVEHKISGAPSDEALVLPDADAPSAGYEIVPSSQAKALVAYLLSLKNDYHLPDEKGPVPPQTAEEKP
jgi:cytochrome c oxidase cbb3-type subunit 2